MKVREPWTLRMRTVNLSRSSWFIHEETPPLKTHPREDVSPTWSWMTHVCDRASGHCYTSYELTGFVTVGPPLPRHMEVKVGFIQSRYLSSYVDRSFLFLRCSHPHLYRSGSFTLTLLGKNKPKLRVETVNNHLTEAPSIDWRLRVKMVDILPPLFSWMDYPTRPPNLLT